MDDNSSEITFWFDFSSAIKHTFQMKKTLARSIIYDFLAKGILYPDEATFNTFLDPEFGDNLMEATHLLQDPREPFREENIKEGFNSLREMAVEGLLTEYERLFGIQSRKIKVVLNQTEVAPQKAGLPTLINVHDLSDLSGFYKAFGFETEKIRVDHFGVELEFMHILSFKEFQAKKEGDKEKTEICINAEKKFLSKYLGSSGLIFAKGLTEASDKAYFKFLAGTFLWLMESELLLFNIALDQEENQELASLPVSASLDERGGIFPGCGHTAKKGNI